MHNGPDDTRDGIEDWKQEVEECLAFMDEVEPDLVTYTDWLEAKGTLAPFGAVVQPAGQRARLRR